MKNLDSRAHSLCIFLGKKFKKLSSHRYATVRHTRTQNDAPTTEFMGEEKNTHCFLAQDTNFQMFQSSRREKNNLIGFWEGLDISLPWWSCLMERGTGRERETERENAARCSKATSAVCLMTFGKCRAHIHLCGRLSTSFTGSAK